MNEEKLACGDANSTDNLVLSPSLTELLPLPGEEKQHNDHKYLWRYPVTSLERLQKDQQHKQTNVVPIGNTKKMSTQDKSKQDTKLFHKDTIGKNSSKTNNLRGSHSDCLTLMENEITMNFVNAAKLFSCQVCHMTPMTSKTVHMCKYGHQVCGNCYNHNIMCLECKEPLIGRNQPVEAALQQFKLLRPQLFHTDYPVQSDKERYDNVTPNRITCQSSHKPVNCPHLTCQKTVAYNGFLQHFRFDHSTVPVVTSAPQQTHNFSLPRNILDTTARVVSVFKVRIFETRLKKVDGDPVICCLQSALMQVGCVDSLAVWCSSIQEGNVPLVVYYLKSLNPRRTVTYRGPLSSLHERPDNILREGRCLLVPAGSTLKEDIFQIEFYINNH